MRKSKTDLFLKRRMLVLETTQLDQGLDKWLVQAAPGLLQGVTTVIDTSSAIVLILSSENSSVVDHWDTWHEELNRSCLQSQRSVEAHNLVDSWQDISEVSLVALQVAQPAETFDHLNKTTCSLTPEPGMQCSHGAPLLEAWFRLPGGHSVHLGHAATTSNSVSRPCTFLRYRKFGNRERRRGRVGLGGEGERGRKGYQKIRLVVGLHGREVGRVELVLLLNILAIPEELLAQRLATRIVHAVTHKARLVVRLHTELAQDLQQCLGAYIQGYRSIKHPYGDHCNLNP